MNDLISYSELRENLKGFLDKVCEEHIPLLVTRRTGEDVVIVSREDYASMEETVYLLSSPANAKKLITAIKRPKKQRKSFASTKALRDAMGV